MVIEKILKQLTPERVKKEIEIIQKIELPPELQKWVKEYEKVGKRNEFIWKFIFQLNKIINPFNLTYKSNVLDLKTLVIMLIVLVDDIAEKNKKEFLIDNLIKNFFDTDSFSKQKISKIISLRIWEYVEKNIKNLSSYEIMKEIFRYDFNQVLNAIKYSYLINKYPFLINIKEYWIYAPYTLQGLINCDIDLMSMSKFPLNEVGKIREIFLSAQKLARITNCLSTWEGEIYDGDLTNTMFVYANDLNIINASKYKEKLDKKSIIKKIKESNVKIKLLNEWENCYKEINNLCENVKSINKFNFLSQLKKLSSMYIIAGNLTRSNV